MRGCAHCQVNVDGPLCPRCGRLTAQGTFRPIVRHVVDRGKGPAFGPCETYHMTLPKMLSPKDMQEEAE